MGTARKVMYIVEYQCICALHTGNRTTGADIRLGRKPKLKNRVRMEFFSPCFFGMPQKAAARVLHFFAN